MGMMLLSAKILILLWLVNFAPPLAACLLGEKWDTPVDVGYSAWRGECLFGAHKTFRGLVAGIAAGVVVGVFLGFPWEVGLSVGILSMGGDLLSSFLKRRLGFPCGKVVPGLDQVFEGLFPFAVLAPYFSLGVFTVAVQTTVFGIGAYAGSLLFNSILLSEPFDEYPRPVVPAIRFKEFRSCTVVSRPWRHLLNIVDTIHYSFLKGAFWIMGLYERGKKNALAIEMKTVTFEFDDLPPAFDGYSILFFSDLHLDGLDGLDERIVGLLEGVEADLCILGGDFRMRTYGSFEGALSRMLGIVPKIRARDGILGILGNHDCLQMVHPLEKAGVNFLINDAARFERDGEVLWIVGVDDPHYYQCHNLEQAFGPVPPGAFTILAVHSNEIVGDASRFKPNLYLCGHSHGGQVQVPGFGPLFTHSRAPRSLSLGPWRYGAMQGYTTAGVGVSGAPVRFFSRGEIVVVRLVRTGGQGRSLAPLRQQGDVDDEHSVRTMIVQASTLLRSGMRSEKIAVVNSIGLMSFIAGHGSRQEQ